jgi:hypothetical protein
MLFQRLDSDCLLLADGGDTLQSFYEANLQIEYKKVGCLTLNQSEPF